MPVAVVNLIEAVNVFPFKSTVPFVNVRIEQDNALPSDQAPPTPLKTTVVPGEIPLVVIVLPVVVALNVVVPEYVRVKFVA